MLAVLDYGQPGADVNKDLQAIVENYLTSLGGNDPGFTPAG